MVQDAHTSKLAHIAEPLRHLAVPVESLTLDPANARKHDQRNPTAFNGSLKRFGKRNGIGTTRESTKGASMLRYSDPWPHTPNASFFATVLKSVVGGRLDEQTLEAAQQAITAAIRVSLDQNPFAPSFLSEEDFQGWLKAKGDIEALASLELMDDLRKSAASGGSSDSDDFCF
jgi:hypothetical protein